MIKICDICGKTFETTRKTYLCSPECKLEHRRAKNREYARTARAKKMKAPKEKTTKTCVVCGKEFIPKSNNQRFCSQQCIGIKSAKKTHIVKCEVCGKKFEATVRGVKFCSSECKAIRHKEVVARSMEKRKEREQARRNALEPQYKSIEEIVRLVGDDESYGYYVGLRYARGERV